MIDATRVTGITQCSLLSHLTALHAHTAANRRRINTRTCGRKTISFQTLITNASFRYCVEYKEYFINDLTCIWMMFGHDDSLLNAVKSWMKKELDWMSKMSWVDDELKSMKRGHEVWLNTVENWILRIWE